MKLSLPVFDAVRSLRAFNQHLQIYSAPMSASIFCSVALSSLRPDGSKILMPLS